MMNPRPTIKITTVLLLFSILSSCSNSSNQEKETHTNRPPIIGSWSIKSIYWMTKDTTYSIEKAQPGMLIINENRYSIMWTPIEEPRTPFENLSEPTDQEIKSGFRSIVFNCGSYEYSDSTITTTAEIAKVPGFENGKQFYNYKLQDDELELIMFDEIYPNGTRPNWYGKYKTKFVLKKIE